MQFQFYIWMVFIVFTKLKIIGDWWQQGNILRRSISDYLSNPSKDQSALL